METSKRTTPAVPAAEALLPAEAPWWDWHAGRTACRYECGRVTTRSPTTRSLCGVNCGDVKPAPEAVRLVEHVGGETRPVLTQFEPGEGNMGE